MREWEIDKAKSEIERERKKEWNNGIEREREMSRVSEKDGKWERERESVYLHVYAYGGETDKRTEKKKITFKNFFFFCYLKFALV